MLWLQVAETHIRSMLVTIVYTTTERRQAMSPIDVGCVFCHAYLWREHMVTAHRIASDIVFGRQALKWRFRKLRETRKIHILSPIDTEWISIKLKDTFPNRIKVELVLIGVRLPTSGMWIEQPRRFANVRIINRAPETPPPAPLN